MVTRSLKMACHITMLTILVATETISAIVSTRWMFMVMLIVAAFAIYVVFFWKPTDPAKLEGPVYVVKKGFWSRFGFYPRATTVTLNSKLPYTDGPVCRVSLNESETFDIIWHP